ncbi:hypothetical protein [Tritonibacter mobilis]|uniref:hypothetical protein n=1 Tax=Tritonibacter mobilis TaxID=379347 RepID=UPI000E0DF17C|nr:hypothetical protein [Tritonibacter mobilis]
MDIEPQCPPENILRKFLDWERDPQKQDAQVFAHPRGIRVLCPSDGERFRVSIPTALRTWWIVPFLAIPAFVLIAISIGLLMSFVAPGYTSRGYTDGYFTPVPLLIGIVVALAGSWFIWMQCFPRVTIEATPEGVTVGKYCFDWRAIEGFRIGYTAGGIERENTQLGFQGLVLGYGPYGFDLPYMVRKYYAAYYVIWLNDMLDTIGKDANAGAHDPKSGFKKAMF